MFNINEIRKRNPKGGKFDPSLFVVMRNVIRCSYIERGVIECPMSGECHVRNCSSLNPMLIVVGTILLLLIMIPSQPVLAIPLQCCVLSGETANINFIVFGLIQLAIEENILNITPMRLGGSV